MYSVNDLINGCTVMSGTMQEISYWWRKKVGKDFFQLNITGKDIRIGWERDGWLFIKDMGTGYTIPAYKRVTNLRQYQVLDDSGRPVDIRTWPKSVWEWEPASPSYNWPCGFKDNHHRSSGPAMWHRTCRVASAGVDEAELHDEGLPFPIRDNTGVRLPFGGTDDSWGYYERHYCHWRSKSWKDQTKAHKQWAKLRNRGEKREDKWARYDREIAVLQAEEPDFLDGEAV